MKRTALIGLLSVALFAPMANADTIADIAVNNGFDQLVAALGAAGLVGTFADANAGPYTVFAPTNEAFAALPAGVFDKLVANTDLLTELLQFHVVEGAVLAETVVTLNSATTLLGEDVRIQVTGNGGVRVNNANVTAVDFVADNGVVHVVDRVLMPKGFLGKLNRR